MQLEPNQETREDGGEGRQGGAEEERGQPLKRSLEGGGRIMETTTTPAVNKVHQTICMCQTYRVREHNVHEINRKPSSM